MRDQQAQLSGAEGSKNSSPLNAILIVNSITWFRWRPHSHQGGGDFTCWSSLCLHHQEAVVSGLQGSSANCTREPASVSALPTRPGPTVHAGADQVSSRLSQLVLVGNINHTRHHSSIHTQPSLMIAGLLTCRNVTVIIIYQIWDDFVLKLFIYLNMSFNLNCMNIQGLISIQAM